MVMDTANIKRKKGITDNLLFPSDIWNLSSVIFRKKGRTRFGVCELSLGELELRSRSFLTIFLSLFTARVTCQQAGFF